MFDPVTAFFATVLVAMGAMSFYGGIQLGVNINFDEDACNNIRIAFQERIVGQKVATQQVNIILGTFSSIDVYRRVMRSRSY